MASEQPLRALAVVCTLTPSPGESSSDQLAHDLIAELSAHGVVTDVIRAVDHDIKPGVQLDMGDGDAWPAIREQVIAADILVLATPTWLGQQSSVCQRVLERLDAELSETDDKGRPRSTARSRSRRSSATRTAHTTSAPSSSRRSTTSASPFRPAA